MPKRRNAAGGLTAQRIGTISTPIDSNPSAPAVYVDVNTGGEDIAACTLLPTAQTTGKRAVAAYISLKRDSGTHPGATIRAYLYDIAGGVVGAIIAISAEVPYDALNAVDGTFVRFPLGLTPIHDGVDLGLGPVCSPGCGELHWVSGGVTGSANAYATAPSPSGSWTPIASTARLAFRLEVSD